MVFVQTYEYWISHKICMNLWPKMTDYTSNNDLNYIHKNAINDFERNERLV
jgi:hypothetical protein